MTVQAEVEMWCPQTIGGYRIQTLKPAQLSIAVADVTSHDVNFLKGLHHLQGVMSTVLKRTSNSQESQRSLQSLQRIWRIELLAAQCQGF